MSNKLYVTAGCAKCLTSFVALKECGWEFEVVFVDKKLQFSKEFKDISPLSQTPVLKTETTSVFGDAAILRFLGRQKDTLYGQCPVKRAHVDSWLETTQELTSHTAGTLTQLLGGPGERLDYTEVSKNIECLVKSFGFVNNYLNGKKFLVGDSLTIADIHFVCLFERFWRYVFNANQRKQLNNITEYISEKINSEPFKGYLVPFKLTEECFPHLQVDLLAEKKKAELEKKKKEEELQKQKELEELEKQ